MQALADGKDSRIMHLSRNLRICSVDNMNSNTRLSYVLKRWADHILDVGNGTAKAVNSEGDLPWVDYPEHMSVASEEDLLK